MAQQIARIWLKPAGEKWNDIVLNEGVGVAHLWSIIMGEGVISAPHFVVPRESIFMITVIGEAQPASTLTVFPGGKAS